MPKFGRDLNLGGVVKELLLTTIATTISIILTFGTAHWIEQRQAEKSRKMLAMTVIHDIEESLNVVKARLMYENDGSNTSRFLLDHIDGLDSIPDDQLLRFYNYVTSSAFDSNREFKKSNENIFNSSQDSWRTLNDRTFINNVQDFYNARNLMENVCKGWVYFQKPVSNEDVYQIVMNSDVMKSRESFYARCKELLQTKEVQKYIETTDFRRNFFRNFLERYANMNEENKYLMNISESDMEAFIKETIKKVHPATEKEITGKWESISIDGARFNQYEYRKDHTFHSEYKTLWRHEVCYGNIIQIINLDGKWSVENDSLIRCYDLGSLKVRIDESEITYDPGRENDVKAMKDELMQRLPDFMEELRRNNRYAVGTNLDPTGRRLELKPVIGDASHYMKKK